MSPAVPILPAGADEPMDEQDTAILAEIRRFWASADPVPPNLADQIQFAVELMNVDVEVARLTEPDNLAAARGDEPSRMITFDSASLTIMVTLCPGTGGSHRIDGWLTPPGCHPIELRAGENTLRTESDASGRFAFGSVAAGPVQLVVRPDDARTVTTPPFSL